MDLICNCKYCNKHDWLFSFPNQDKVYLEIPKNASSIAHRHFNIQRCNKNLQLKRPQFNKLKQTKELTGVLILREPFDRFKSLVSHYFFKGGRKHKGDKWLKENNLPPLNTNQAASTILDNFPKLNTISEPHHWMPQSDFVLKEFMELPKMEVYNLDTFKKTFTFKILNKSNSKDIILSPNDKVRIKEIYNEDFNLYNTYFK